MPLVSPSFSEEFRIKGTWWLPDCPDKQVVGTLCRDRRSTELDLFGDFRETVWRPGEIAHAPSAPIILGQLENGTACTLYKNFLVSRTLNILGPASSSRWNVSFVFIGKQMSRANDLRFSSVSLGLTDLENWIGPSGFRVPQYRTEHKKVASVDTGFDYPNPVRVPVPTIGATVTLEHALTSSIDMNSQAMKYRASFTITPRRPRRFEWFLRATSDLQNLLSLLVSEPVHVTRFCGLGKLRTLALTKSREETHVYWHQTDRKERKSLHPGQMLFAFPRVKDRFRQLLRQWFSKIRRFRDALNLFFAAFYTDRINLQSHFLTTIQALETYSRSLAGGRYVGIKVYETIRKTLSEAIPPGTPQRLRQSLNARLVYGNELSLRNRLRRLLEVLEPETVQLFSPDIKGFCDKLVDTRNFLTHYDRKLRRQVIQGEQLYRASQRMKLLFVILLLKELGFSEVQIREVIMSNSAWMQQVVMYFREPL